MILEALREMAVGFAAAAAWHLSKGTGNLPKELAMAAATIPPVGATPPVLPVRPGAEKPEKKPPRQKDRPPEKGTDPDHHIDDYA